MASERAEFIATLDTKQVDQSIDRTRAAVMTGVTANGQFVTSLGNMEAAAGRAAKGFWSLEGAAKGMQQRMAPQAAAISNITAVLGDNAGATGKAVAAVGQLAASYAAGGPLGVALAAAGAGVGLLTQHWEALIKAQDEALKKQYAASDAVIGQRKTVEDRLLALRKELGGPETAAQAFARVQKEIDEAEKALTVARANRDRAGWVNLTKTIELLREIQGLEAAKATRGTGSNPARALPGRGGSETPEESLGPGEAFSFSMVEEDPAEKARRQAQDRAAEMSLRADDIARDARWNAEQADADRRQAALEASLQKDLATRERYAAQALAIGVGSAMALTEAIIDGQEDAFAHFASSVMKQAGTVMVGHGIEAVAGGVALAWNPATAALGAAGIATGAALISGGMALGASGAAIDRAVAGPQAGRGAQSRAATDRGVNRSPAGGGSRSRGSESLVINISYGAAGPAPEDTGRAVYNALQTHNRRSGRTEPQGPRR